MNALTQGWLVAARELRERGRSRAFLASLAIMILVVVGAIVLPSALGGGGGTKDVGLSGSAPEELAGAIEDHGAAVGIAVRVHGYDDLATAEEAARHGDVDVLVVDGQRLEWRKQTDEQLRAVVTGAIQLVAVRERAAAAGISPDELVALVSPVPIDEVELGTVAGQGPDDETAVMLMTILLFFAITTYGNLVLTGVVEEKASRVIEVLLARVPARTLLAGKVAGIGLLGLAQFAVTALAALVAATVVDSVDVPAARGGVLAWAVVWFVLGYALYATVYGALGSLASRAEDAQSVAGPVIFVLLAAYFASMVASGVPDSALARLASYFPATAPLVMPGRIAMGVTAWWEPLVAVALTLATIVALVQLGGRVYAGAVLHTGPTLRVRDVLRNRASPGAPATHEPRRPSHAH